MQNIKIRLIAAAGTLTIFSMAVSILCQSADASDYTCKYVEKSATLSASGVTVSQSEDKDKKSCSFSISGSGSSSSSSSSLVKYGASSTGNYTVWGTKLASSADDARNRIQLSIREYRVNGDATALQQNIPLLLVAAGPTPDLSIPQSLRNVLEVNKRFLDDCFSAFAHGGGGMPKYEERNGLGCGGRATDGQDSHVLRIRAEFDHFVNSVFIPARG